MKRLPGLLLILLVAILPGCKKSGPDTLNELNAHVIDGGDPATDGLGFYIHVDSTMENVIPLNLPVDFQKRSINAPVAIKFVDTGNRRILGFGGAANGGYRVVYVVAVHKL